MDSSVEISRPIDQVFAYLSTPSNWTQWLEGFTESHQEGEGSLLVGSKVSQTIKLQRTSVKRTDRLGTIELIAADDGFRLAGE